MNCDVDSCGQVTCDVEETGFVSIDVLHNIKVTTKIWYCPHCYQVFDNSVKVEPLDK